MPTKNKVPEAPNIGNKPKPNHDLPHEAHQRTTKHHAGGKRKLPSEKMMHFICCNSSHKSSLTEGKREWIGKLTTSVKCRM